MSSSGIASLNLSIPQDQPSIGLESLLRALRFWNRAADALTRLAQSARPREVKDPFKEPLPALGHNTSSQERQSVPEAFRGQIAMGKTEWRISQGLISTLLTLCQAHFLRGSPRESEYFASQAQELSKSISIGFMVGHALLKRGELQLCLNKLQDAHALLTEAINALGESVTFALVDGYRLLGVHDFMNHEEDCAAQHFANATSALSQLQEEFVSLDDRNPG
jgi:separase